MSIFPIDLKLHDLNSTIEFMCRAHEGQVDKGGMPYCLHPYSVMNRLGAWNDSDLFRIALLHDVIENNPDITMETLIESGYSEFVAGTVDLLSRKEGEIYQGYILRIINSENQYAAIVKYADLVENSSPLRLSYIKDLKKRDSLAKRYIKALSLLKNVIGEEERFLIQGGRQPDVIEDHGLNPILKEARNIKTDLVEIIDTDE